MGRFYGSIHMRSVDTSYITDIIKGITINKKQKFLVSPCINGWISIYPSGRGQDSKISAAIAQQFSGYVLHLILHDEDAFYYLYYRNNQLIDEYSSDPDYFDTVSLQERQRLCGKPEVFTDLLTELPNSLTTVEKIAEVLTVPGKEGEEEFLYSLELLQRTQSVENRWGINEAPEENIFEATTRLSRFAQSLNISNALTCYEYLQEDEDTEIEKREEFFQIPDLSIELAQKQREQARINRKLAELNQAGVLLVSVPNPSFKKQFPPIPILTPARSNGFFIGWLGFASACCEIKPYAPPWNEEPSSLGLVLENGASMMQTSPSERFLAVGYASGSSKVTLYDLEQKTLLQTIPHVRNVSGLLFSPDEKILISRSRDEIILTSVSSLQQIASIKVGQGSKIALHPGGRYLVADELEARLTIVDLHTQQVLKVLSTAAMDMAAWTASVQRGEGVNGFHFNEMIVKIDFSPDGQWLFCAMAQGVRAFNWSEVFLSSRNLPLPVAASSSEVVTISNSRMARTYDIAFDWQHNTLLSCGMEGKIKSLDLATGDSKVLLELPGEPSVLQIDLSRDLKTFCTHSMNNNRDARKREPSIVQIWNYSALI